MERGRLGRIWQVEYPCSGVFRNHEKPFRQLRRTMMSTWFRRWDGQDHAHYYSISVPLIFLIVLFGGMFALLLPAMRWLLSIMGWR